MYSSSAATGTGLLIATVIVLISLLALYFIIRSAVAEGMKNYAIWREQTGRDVPPAAKRKAPPAP